MTVARLKVKVWERATEPPEDLETCWKKTCAAGFHGSMLSSHVLPMQTHAFAFHPAAVP